jgi:hypothetical protein
MRSAQAMGAHVFPAIAFGGKVAQYVNNKYPDMGVRFYVESFGELNTLYWCVDGIEDLNDFNGKVAALMADQEYVGIVSAAGEFWVPGGGRDTLLMEVTG